MSRTANLNLLVDLTVEQSPLTSVRALLDAIDSNMKAIDAFAGMKGVANGFASLDATGKVPVAQIPDDIAAGITIRRLT